jgi:hypothetical protein
MFSKTIKVDYPFFRVVADGGISNPALGEGRMIPVVMIDTHDNVGVVELLKLHENTPPGDVELRWSLPNTLFSKPKSVLLNITFLKPMKLTFGIEFPIAERHSVIDGIIQSRVFALQNGKSGEKVSTILLDNSKKQTSGCVFIEVPNMAFDNKWKELLLDFLKHKYKKQGASKKEAALYAEEQIKSMREIWNIRRLE